MHVLHILRSGIPPFVDLAAVRDTVVRLGGDPNKVVSQCPVDVVIDHFVPMEPAKRFDDIFSMY
jgi:aconitate hydratase